MLFFEDIDTNYQSTVGTYKLDRDEVVAFAKRWDPQPFHIDEEAANNSIFEGLIASSLHLFAICTRLFFDHEDKIQILAMLGKDLIRLHNPARPGDTLTYSTQCIEHRPSENRQDRGIVILEDTLKNQNGDIVLTQRVSLLVKRIR